jgi:cell wall-associated NlpC family hydrolase
MLGIAVMMLAATLGISPAGAANQVDPDADTAATAPATGDIIADFALQFLGYPYVWAGNTPAGFDCSGFTQYVTASTTGLDIGHDTAGQTAYGAFVDWGAWQPGDLVYFANTYGAGISHAGVYIGDGQFVHAENPSTGVTVSSLYSDYYASHYYGAYRIV